MDVLKIKNSSKLLMCGVALFTVSACGTTTTQEVDTKTRVNNAITKAAVESSKDTPRSMKMMETVYKNNPNDVEAATAYGTKLREDGNAEKAAMVLQSAAKSQDATYLTMREYAAAQLELGDYNTAENFARKAISKNNKDGQSWHVLGIALDAQAKHEEAETAFRKALDLWKGDPVPIMNNLALNLASQNRVADAVEILQRAKELAPNRVEVERNLRIIPTLNEKADEFPKKTDS